MLLPRILSAVIGVPLILAAIYKGGPYLFVLVAAIAVLGFYEFSGIISHGRSPVLQIAGNILCLAVIAFAQLKVDAEWVIMVVVSGIIMFLGVQVISKGSYSMVDIFAHFFGCFYISLPLGLILIIRDKTSGQWFVTTLFLIVWVTDVTAYFLGTLYGKHPLILEISPHKTWEGAIMGLIGATVVGGLALPLAGLTVRSGLALGLTVGLVGQIGDLAESSIKRWAGVKDSGHLIPGHGGILDRFDSLLFAAPLFYFILRFLAVW